VHSDEQGHDEFARLLVRMQERAGLTTTEIADAAGVNRSQVWRWINSGVAPGGEPVRRLAAWLKAGHPELGDIAARLLTAAGYEVALDDAPRSPVKMLEAVIESPEYRDEAVPLMEEIGRRIDAQAAGDLRLAGPAIFAGPGEEMLAERWGYYADLRTADGQLYSLYDVKAAVALIWRELLRQANPGARRIGLVLALRRARGWL
jgi:transcriptional regulator with XRE-family HTH domain